MRIWSLHPSLLDTKGLVACWRETLLAQAVLLNQTKGYKNHSQLTRFKQKDDPTACISYYLETLWNEAFSRGYNFDRNKIVQANYPSVLQVTKGQVEFELHHLKNKVTLREPKKLHDLDIIINQSVVNPLFKLVEGNIESWEII